MCRNIKNLRHLEHPPTDQDIQAAAIQYVRKVSGYRAPSRLNQDAFNLAVEEVALATRKLLGGLVLR